MTLPCQGALQTGHQPVQSRLERLGIRRPEKDRCKFLTARARHQVIVSDGTPQTSGEFRQHRVTSV
jgi:hypothetical protein